MASYPSCHPGRIYLALEKSAAKRKERQGASAYLTGIIMWNHNYFVYITTNPRKTVYYVGVTNNLEMRVIEHQQNKGKPETFAGRYYCYKLLYYERYSSINQAIEREKEIKLMTREAKEVLIKSENPTMAILKISP